MFMSANLTGAGNLAPAIRQIARKAHSEEDLRVTFSRKPLTPEALAADFGPQGDIAPNLVNVFYTALQTHRNHPRVATFFAEWDRIFGIVYGKDLGKAERDAPALAALYRAVPGAEFKPLFFAVHTYYTLLMKFLAVELASLQGGALRSSFVAALPAMTEKELRRELTSLENGRTFSLLGINNFLEGDFFGWYLDAWEGQTSEVFKTSEVSLADGIRALARTLADFEPATTTLKPEHTRDLLKKLYQYLVPRKLRHDLGEYYTPDWLAERLLNQVGYKGKPGKRLIDPGCGSGTFLILALRRLRQYAAGHLIPPADVLDAALRNIVGFDLNPLSVIAARTNYLLALGDLLRYRRGPVDLPVYMCDGILTPTERADIFSKSYRLRTVVGDLDIPGEVVGEFDFVVGNPPWVNWEGLSDEYREAAKRLWVDYGLFSLTGHAARLGGGKKDLAMLFAYVSIDHYLKKGGKLGFVITQTVFKTKGAGDGFRRFRLGEKGEHLRVLHVDDLSRLQPFEGATNRTSVLVCQRGQKTRYPVPYTLWSKGTGTAHVDIDKPLEEVLAETERADLWAQPVDGKTPTSPWMTACKAALKALQKVIGPAAYQARAGSCTWLNGVYWVEVQHRLPDGNLLIQNLGDIGRKKVDIVQAAVEPDLVYPLLRGRDVGRWMATPSAYLLQVQDPEARTGYDERWLQSTLPKTYSYLKQFEKQLRGRSGYRKYLEKQGATFYSIYNVGTYTLAPFKVVWRYIASDFICAVVTPEENEWLGQKVTIPDAKLMLVAVESEREAHYLCGVLNSVISRLIVNSYVVGTQISTHILQHIAVPQFNAENPIHTRLAALSQQAHQLAAAQTSEVSETSEVSRRLVEVEAQVDEAAAELWGITDRELREIRRSLEELG
jgi:SAM-dependent methyltransferase